MSEILDRFKPKEAVKPKPSTAEDLQAFKMSLQKEKKEKQGFFRKALKQLIDIDERSLQVHIKYGVHPDDMDYSQYFSQSKFDDFQKLKLGFDLQRRQVVEELNEEFNLGIDLNQFGSPTIEIHGGGFSVGLPSLVFGERERFLGKEMAIAFRLDGTYEIREDLNSEEEDHEGSVINYFDSRTGQRSTYYRHFENPAHPDQIRFKNERKGHEFPSTD
jgi:hypothetical protein